MKNLLPLLAAPLLALMAAASAQAQQTPPEMQGKVAMCIGCHGIPGYQASFPEIYKVPMISGQNEKFIAAALQAYRKGERKHPTMRGIAEALTDEDITAIAAFYAKHGGPSAAPPEQPAQASPEVAALLQKGGCAACHGVNYNKPIDGAYPKVAGQHADYLYHALKAYQTEGNPKVGRANAIMAAQVKQFNPDQLKQIAKYLGSLPGELKTVRQPPFK